MTAPTTTAEWFARLDAGHAAEVAKGLHDAGCEVRPRSYICHCAMRRRIAAAFTEPPGELIHRAPLCPRCENEVECDADGFTCEPCAVHWGMGHSDRGTFTDDYGDLSPGAPS